MAGVEALQRQQQQQQHPATRLAQEMLAAEQQRFAEAETRADTFPLRHKSDYARLRKENELLGRGRLRLEAFEDALRFLFEHGVQLGYLQQRLVAAARTVLLSRMFGNDLVNDMAYLKQRFNLTRLYKAVAVIMPRRIGKTTVQALLAAAIAVSQADGNVCCFNIKGRQARAWLKQTIGFLEYFKDHERFGYEEINRDSKEYIVIKNWTGTTAQISSFPGPVDEDGSNYRGMGVRLMFMFVDEFYFFKPHVYTTIFPLLSNGAGIMLTSSMSKSSDDTIRRMVYAKIDDEQDAMLRLDWVQACPDCKRKNVADRCTHITPQPQHFQRRETQKFVRALIAPFGKENYDREMLNIARASALEPVFDARFLEPLTDRNNDYVLKPTREHRHIFIGVDPAGEGFSQTAIVSAVIDRRKPPLGLPFSCIVLGAESLMLSSVAAEDIARAVLKHAIACRSLPGCSNATVVIIIESNMVGIAEGVKRVVKQSRLPRYVIMEEDPKKARRGMGGEDVIRPGTRTSNTTKDAQMTALKKLIEHGGLRLNSAFVVAQPDLQPPDEGPSRDNLVTELRNMRIETIPPKRPSPYARPIRKYSGRHQNGGRARDDYVMALGFILLMVEVFNSSPKYVTYRI